MAESLSRGDKSTTDRSKTVAMGALQMYFRSISAVAPGLAVHQATRIFFTPQRRPKRIMPPVAGREPEHLEMRVGRDVMHAWRYGIGPAVVFVHGWGGSAHDWPAAAARVVEAGYSAVLCDFPGHGHATGRQTTLPEMAAALRVIANEVAFTGRGRFEPLEAIVAHSFGGAASILAVRDGLLVRSMVLLAPVAHPMAFVDPVIEAIGLAPRLKPAMVEHIRRRAGGDLRRIEVLPALSEVKARALVVHDHHDATVPWSDGLAIAQAWGGARLVSTDGLGHRGVLKDEGVLQTATEFLLEGTERTAAQPWPIIEAVVAE
jgi:pimeloyl-ACP methyl ester carboxylesterase